jgi:hypothetical protein
VTRTGCRRRRGRRGSARPNQDTVLQPSTPHDRRRTSAGRRGRSRRPRRRADRGASPAQCARHQALCVAHGSCPRRAGKGATHVVRRDRERESRGVLRRCKFLPTLTMALEECRRYGVRSRRRPPICARHRPGEMTPVRAICVGRAGSRDVAQSRVIDGLPSDANCYGGGWAVGL